MLTGMHSERHVLIGFKFGMRIDTKEIYALTLV